MEKENIKNLVTKFVNELLFIENENALGENTLLFEEGLLDSMGFISLITFIQDEFEILPTDDEMTEDNFGSISSITNYILTNLN